MPLFSDTPMPCYSPFGKRNIFSRNGSKLLSWLVCGVSALLLVLVAVLVVCMALRVNHGKSILGSLAHTTTHEAAAVSPPLPGTLLANATLNSSSGPNKPTIACEVSAELTKDEELPAFMSELQFVLQEVIDKVIIFQPADPVQFVGKALMQYGSQTFVPSPPPSLPLPPPPPPFVASPSSPAILAPSMSGVGT